MKENIVVFWFRRDLRLSDNAGLSQALSSGFPVLPVFIFDTTILEALNQRYDRRVDYIHQALNHLHQSLQQQGRGLQTYFETPVAAFQKITGSYTVQAVYCNGDYEPEARQRDAAVQAFLQAQGIRFYAAKDQVIFEKDDVVKTDGLPYTVFTPYANRWRQKLQPADCREHAVALQNFLPLPPASLHTLEEIGFEKTDLVFSPPVLNAEIIAGYDKHRDFPALDGTTRLGTALRFGTISIRRCVAFAVKQNQTWLSELIWREFFMQILYHFPTVVQSSFKEKYEAIAWRNREEEFERWCEGKTGYPLVDAGMRQLNETGFMHNRVRMVVASFLCKHLLIDWRWGEAYFAEKLNDYELSSNNGNWQWAAGCGCDAAPYFRIFNPAAQCKKFDKDLVYTRRWNPDFETAMIPPIVQHEAARSRALQAYKKALQVSEDKSYQPRLAR